MKLQKEKGITLIALIVTIIILIILAGISISILTGDNGIIDQAHTAKEDTEIASWEEQIDLAIIDAEKKHRDTTMENVIEELINKKVINDESQVDKDTGTITTNEPSYVLEDKLADYVIKIPTLAEITGSETENTIAKDNLGNKIKIPAGFKVVNPEENVENGIIIEDVAYEATKGSQFVWIPVGTIKTSKGDITINLDRYTFDEKGKETKQGNNKIQEGEKFFEELISSDTGNKVGKDITLFKSQVITTGGFYIGRYEARDGGIGKERSFSSSDKNQVVVKEDNYIYNYVSQTAAANLSQDMYKENEKFTSDLVNSYAWDTTIVFLQNFDDRKIKNIPYSQQKSINSDLELKGTKNTEAEDKICNIYDIASNCLEWTTETVNQKSYATMRGGLITNGVNDAAFRSGLLITDERDNRTFRVIIYL